MAVESKGKKYQQEIPMRVERVKKCDRCLCPAPVLYRVQYDASQQWLFVCDRCFPSMSQDNLNYRYGGTWKARKKP